MELQSQSAINPRHKSRPIKQDQPSIAWIKFITPSSSFGPSLECPTLESTQISWISPLSVSLIFLDLALVIGLTGTCNGSLNACWFSSGTLNGNFVKEGGNFPYYGFPKPWVGKDGRVYPSWQTFFNEKLTFKEKPTIVIKEM